MFKSTLFWKVFILLGLTILMLIPISMVLDLIDSRNEYQQSVIQRVEDGTSGAQTIVGPVLVLPYTETVVQTDGQGISTTKLVEGKLHI